MKRIKTKNHPLATSGETKFKPNTMISKENLNINKENKFVENVMIEIKRKLGGSVTMDIKELCDALLKSNLPPKIKTNCLLFIKDLNEN